MKFLNNPAFTILIGTLIGLLIRTLAINNDLSDLPISVNWIIIILMIIMILLLGIVLNKINDVQESQESVHSDLLNGFKVITPDEGSKFAAQLMEDVTITRIIGTARQDSIDKQKHEVASKYWTSCEKRFSKNKHVIYKRITSTQLTPAFKNHLSKCFTEAEKNNHNIGVALIDNIDLVLSYQVFDDKGILLIVDNVRVEGLKDNALMFWSTNPITIRTFTKHFDNAWSKLTPISNNQTFSQI